MGRSRWHIALILLVAAIGIGSAVVQAQPAKALKRESIDGNPPSLRHAQPHAPRSERNRSTFKIQPKAPADPIEGGECLARSNCSKSPGGTRPRGTGHLLHYASVTPTAPAPRCAAEQTLHSLPARIRRAALGLIRSTRARACHAAIRVVNPIRDRLRELYSDAPPESLAGELVDAAKRYTRACLDRRFLEDRGGASARDIRYLRKHVGLLVRRYNENWGDAEPICHAVRFSRYLVTAQHCAPIDSASASYKLGYAPEIAFRFLDRPTLYGVALKRVGSEQDFEQARHLDFAVFEIVGSPELEEREPPRIGRIRLFDDLIVLSSNVYARIASDIHSGVAPSFVAATRLENSTLCRPAHISDDGIFLHGCQTEGGTSGAPFFQRRNGRLVFVGIHNGTTDSLDDPSLARCAGGLPNYGIAIAPAMLRDVFKR